MSFSSWFASTNVPAQAQHDVAVRSVPAAFVYPFVIVVICATTDYLQHYPFLIVTALACSLTAAICRYVWSRKFSMGAHSDVKYSRIRGAVVLTCMSWGLFAALTLRLFGFDTWSISVTILATATLAAGATNTLAPDRILVHSGISLILLPAIFCCLFLFSKEPVVIGTLGFIYFGFLQYQAHLNWTMHQKLLGIKATEQLMQLAEASTRAKSEMIAVLSHEIRTPLNGLLGMLEIVQQSELSADQRQSMELATTAGNGLVVVLNRILDYSKSEAEGRLVCGQVDFRLDHCLENCLSTFRSTAEGKGLQFTADIDVAARKTYRGDPVRLAQVLNNLVSNAVKFTATGEVNVAVNVERTSETIHLVRFSVKDSGIGITSTAQQRLFQPFVQADKSVQITFGGTGLGLAISRQLVTAMNGTIEMTSSPGIGSTFTFALPLEMAGMAQSGTNAIIGGVEPAKRTGKILVAEDNVVNQRMAVRMLERLGYEVILVNNGLEAFQAASNTKFNLILMDCQMPQLDGFLATEQIRKNERDGRVSIVALTASAALEDQERAIVSGMDAVLTKPYTYAQLTEIVDRYCA